MSAWTGKPCQECGRKKTPKQRDRKYCYSCGRERNKTRSRKAYFARISATYNITEKQYQAIYDLQGGKCFLCEHAFGRSRRLSVDHDHRCCAGARSCGQCVRGLLCTVCNRFVLGRAARDSAEFFRRGVRYLTSPPAWRVIPRAAAPAAAGLRQPGRVQD